MQLTKIDKANEKKGKEIFDLYFNFNANTGQLRVSTDDAQFKLKKVKFDVNGKKYNVDMDENGNGYMQFEKSVTPEKYVVRVDDKKTLAKDQKLLFFY